MKNKFLGLEDIKQKFGVKPEQIIDVQSLAGDTSDNVPGVPGIGIKTAAELINTFGTLDKLLKNAHTIKQNKKRETLIENKDKAIISKKLVTLKKDVPVKQNLDDFILKDIDKDKLYSFLREMEFNRLLSSAISTYGETGFDIGKKKKKKNNSNDEKISKDKYFLFKDENEVENWLKEADEVGEFAIDTETTSLDAHQADLVGISLCYKPGHSGYIPLKHVSGKNLDPAKVLKILKPYLEDKSIKKIGQNIKFDYIIFFKRGIEINSLEDTMLMSYVLDAGKNRHNLDILAEIHLQHKNI